jgi:integrase
MSYGQGSVFAGKTKAGKKVWFVEVIVGHKANGKPITTRRTAHTLQAARRIQTELNSSKDQGKLTQQHNISIADFGRHWAREVKVNSVKISTASGYEWLLRKYVYPRLGNKRIADLTYRDVTGWINDLWHDGLGTSTINSARAVLGQICKQAVREQILGSNPVALTDKVRKHNGEKTQVRKSWSKEEAREVLKACEGTDMDLFIHLCLTLGLRHGEALGLQWEAVDFEARTIEIKFTLKDERRETITGKGVVSLKMQDPKTKSSIRKLPITDQLFASFERHKMWQSMRKMTAGETWQESGMVFTSSIGTGVYQANNRDYFYRFLKKHGLRQIRVHDMRHSFGTIALEGEAPIEAVSQAMGHSDIGITKKIYAPNVQGLSERALKAFEGLVMPDVKVVRQLTQQSEEITELPLEIRKPVPLSQRPNRAQIDYRAKQKSNG